MSNKSEIYAQGYEKWDGARDRALPPWLLIAKAGFKNIVKPSGCMGRMIFIFGFVIPLGNYYFLIIVGSLARFQLENLKKYEFFRQMAISLNRDAFDLTEAVIHMNNILWPSLFFSLAGMIFYGAQLISKDKQANALQVYFSKAISPTDYILGKFLAVGFLTSIVSLIPSALILLLGLLFSTDHATFLRESWYIPILSGSYWLFLTVAIGSITLYFSSCFNKSYMAGVGIIGFLIFCWVFSLILVFIFGSSNFLEGLALPLSIHDVGEVIYKLKVRSWGALSWQLFDLILISGAMIYLTYRNIQPVEVVK